MAQEVKTTENKTAPDTKSSEGFWVGSAELRKEFDRLFDTLMQPTSWLPGKLASSGIRPPWNWNVFAGGFSPAVDFEEKEAQFVITAEIPGVEAKDLNVDITGETLTITGEKIQEEEQKDKNFHIKERHVGSFQRSFPLPRKVDSDKISASFDKGILTIVLPKTNAGNSNSKKVSITTP